MPRRPSSSQLRSICPRRMDLRALISDVCTSFADRFASQSISCDIDVPHNLWAELDPILLREAIRKLVDNAVEAMPTGGSITITSLIGRHGLEIEVADSGTGVSDDIEARLFEPYVTDKEDRAGLGLSIVREIATAHQGQVSVQNCPEGGAAFTFLLPFRTARQAAA